MTRTTKERKRPRSGVQSTAVSLPGGTFLMGSDRHYPEEAPTHHVRVAAFAIDPFPVTNAEFASFVRATSHAASTAMSTPSNGGWR